ncbi:hypothetical protein [Mameliella sediminis]|uniref:hypothetical protein n=1 Tax=Mameliella sediminis TaxID=2836866 RepID=UPI001C43C9CF|nr:hypothetical protein [Mameliella sediminis]MBY6113619.1 hypothetical protein [Antarctobacter heliothermus]MBY6143033.1 hypothetical protein [Mameliella alba]MBV7394916.1 hypothetical protein [Mameliella sediminis]MBY6159888.1 hypothetical protein [Mameliella alba]MBY6168359.1 hypothetical protein [Mameliella alba]
MHSHTTIPFPDTNIDTTIAQHGALRVLAAAAVALFRAPTLRPPPTPTDALSDHLRRDVGLPPHTVEDRRVLADPFRY